MNMGKEPLLPKSALSKTPTGILGFDQITNGGLPKARPTLVCGSAGCGKTLFGMEFLVRGAMTYGEPGVFLAFEETREQLSQNFASLGFDLEALIAQNLIVVDYVEMDWDSSEISGRFNLDGLFIRLDYAIKKVNAQRVVLDTLEILFNFLGDTDTLRSELHRLFRWLKERGVTTIVTGESSGNQLTRRGIEAYISDCVIFLDQRVENQITRRRLRIIKYRGTKHGTDEYPFLISSNGLSLLPINEIGLDYPVTEERVSTGVERLDAMLEGKGLFRGSTCLVSGASGTGKTSIAAHFVAAACQRGERCLYFSFEESTGQIIRNMRSIGIDLKNWIESDLLRFQVTRPTTYGLEMHIAIMHASITEFDPHIVIIDPVTNFDVIGSLADSRQLLTRMIDFLKMRGITAMLTSLTRANNADEQTEVNISSLVDTWILVHNVESNGERNRILYILKSRGMQHSNQITEFEITSEGVQLIETYLGTAGVLTGSARMVQEAREYDEELINQQTLELKRLQLERKRIALQAQIDTLTAELDIENAETQLLLEQNNQRKKAAERYANILAQKRKTISSGN